MPPVPDTTCLPTATLDPPVATTSHPENDATPETRTFATAQPLVADDLPTTFHDPVAWLVAQRLIAAIAIVALSPLLVLLVVAIRLESRGPAFFRQSRPGLHERPFTILKFRTMGQGSERATALGTTGRSSHVTRVGRLLRRTKLDELPQLWNVMRGEMAFVGPRPIPVALDETLRAEIPGFAARYRVRPGLTNAAQVSIYENRLGDALIDDWSMRFEAEAQYLRRRSVAFDCVLIVMTILFVARKALPSRRPKPTPVGVPSISVLGAPIACLDYDGVERQVAEWIADGRREFVGIAPVHSVIESVLHRSHRASLRAAGLNTADGMPVVWAKRLLGDRRSSRVYGPTLMLRLLERAEREGWSVAFYGGRPEALDLLGDRMAERFPRLRVAAAISPPFGCTPEEEAPLLDELRAADPKLVFVGLGCPKQEAWMARHVGEVPGVLLGVGAAFDFHAGTVEQAPAWMQRLGLEWAFRLSREPKRLFRRYATTNPIYVGAISLQLLAHALLFRRYRVTHVPVRAGGAR